MSNDSDAAAHTAIPVRLTLDPSRLGPIIRPEIYGHFAEHLGRCIYEGIWVGEESEIPNVRGIRRDVVEALKKLRVPVLRWPGGCFADEYHWKDGVGPRERRPRMLNTHWGGVVESNHFGTHEFMDLCEQLEALPYVCGNVGSGTVQEMMEWVEYMTSDADSPMANWRRQNGRAEPWRVPYFGVGNEAWGCGGNMRPEFYADNYRRYATFVKNYGGHRVQRVACGANGADYAWTDVLMSRAANHMDGLSLHWYSVADGNWSRKGSATEFGEDEWHSILAQALRMEEIVAGHATIMDRYDSERRVGLVVDEWGTWYDVEPGTNPGFLYQQNTLRDALVAAVTLNVFHRQCERVSMTNIAQTINVLQAMVLTESERMIVTPSYHVFEMYKVHQGASLVRVELDPPSYERGGVALPSVHASASRDSAGVLHLSLVQLDPQRGAELAVHGLEGRLAGRVLTAARPNDHNTFDAPDVVSPAVFDDFRRAPDGTTLVRLPPKSVVVLSSDQA